MKKENHNALPDSVLTKEFLSQFKTEDDVSKFLTKLHAQVLEKMLEGEMDVHLGPFTTGGLIMNQFILIFADRLQI